MKLFRRLLTFAIVFLVFAASWLWWNRPKKTDMAVYAPADSLVYVESNSLIDVAANITNTDAWKTLGPLLGANRNTWQDRWLQHLSAWTGIGPAQTVILTRAQVAVVMVDLSAAEEGATLRVKPEAALLIETHTTERRIKPVVEKVLTQFAEHTYGQPTFVRSNLDGAEFTKWTVPATNHQIVATINGSLVIIGNSERAVKACLAVRLGQRPSLRDDAEMREMRGNLAADSALAFGYVSSGNTARLFSFAAPLLFGKAPGDLQLERLIASGAAKVLGSVGWSSHPFMGGIEDRYLFSLKPAVVSRLRPFFRTTKTSHEFLALLPEDFYSLTIYKYESPAAAWQGVESAISSQLDTLSAVIFTSLVRSALLPYGIEEPEKFLRAVSPELFTVRLESGAERSLLVAGARDKKVLQEMVTQGLGQSVKGKQFGRAKIVESSEKRSAVSFIDGYLVMGSPADVQRCVQLRSDERPISNEERFKVVSHFVPFSSSANIVTYTNEVERVRNFLSTIAGAKGAFPNPKGTTGLNQAFAELPYSATETSLGDHGLERRTRSSFGQFSTLVPLLYSDQLNRGQK
jgi:hypothetical protein